MKLLILLCAFVAIFQVHSTDNSNNNGLQQPLEQEQQNSQNNNMDLQRFVTPKDPNTMPCWFTISLYITNSINQILPALMWFPTGILMALLNFMFRGSHNGNIAHALFWVNLLILTVQMTHDAGYGESGEEQLMKWSNNTDPSNMMNFWLGPEILNQMRNYRFKKLRESNALKVPKQNKIIQGMAWVNVAMPVLVMGDFRAPLFFAAIFQRIDQETVMLLSTVNFFVYMLYPNYEFLNVNIVLIFLVVLACYRYFNRIWQNKVLGYNDE